MPRSTVVIISGTTWTVPKSWNNSNNSVSCIGGGAGGGYDSVGLRATGGGGGGARATSNNITLTPGASVAISIGAGGAVNGAGGDTSFNSGAVLAKGGSSAGASATGGVGGSATTSVGTTKWAGGNGGNAGSFAQGFDHGGGGGAGGTTAAGGNGSARTSGAGGATGGAASQTSATADAQRGLFYGTNYSGSGGVGAKNRDSDKSGETFFPGGSGGLFGAGGGGTAIIGGGQPDGSNYAEGGQGAIIVSWEWTPVALPATGNTIAISNVNQALGFPSTVSNNLDDLSIRTLFSVPSGQISLSSGYGLSSSKFGVMAGGFTVTSTALTSKYYYATDATTTGTDLPSIRHAMGQGGSGNDTRAIFFCGSNNTVSPIATTAKYTYSGDATAAGTTITTAANYGSATGTTTDGYAIGGATNLASPGTITTRHIKYTYASDTQTAAASMTAAKWIFSSITDKSTVAIHGGGNSNLTFYTATSQKYTYASNTMAAGTSLPNPKSWSVGIGNATVGIITSGLQTAGENRSSYKYTYSGDVVSTGTTLSVLRWGGGSVTSNVAGVITYGQANNFWVSPFASVEIYRYSNETTSIGSNLSFPRLQTTGTGVTGAYFS